MLSSLIRRHMCAKNDDISQERGYFVSIIIPEVSQNVHSLFFRTSCSIILPHCTSDCILGYSYVSVIFRPSPPSSFMSLFFSPWAPLSQTQRGLIFFSRTRARTHRKCTWIKKMMVQLYGNKCLLTGQSER